MNTHTRPYENTEHGKLGLLAWAEVEECNDEEVVGVDVRYPGRRTRLLSRKRRFWSSRDGRNSRVCQPYIARVGVESRYFIREYLIYRLSTRRNC